MCIPYPYTRDNVQVPREYPTNEPTREQNFSDEDPIGDNKESFIDASL